MATLKNPKIFAIIHWIVVIALNNCGPIIAQQPQIQQPKGKKVHSVHSVCTLMHLLFYVLNFIIYTKHFKFRLMSHNDVEISKEQISV